MGGKMQMDPTYLFRVYGCRVSILDFCRVIRLIFQIRLVTLSHLANDDYFIVQ